ncbi:MAG TPA: glycerate kinase [Solirubrobacteraceae bacterium]|nr:glycerate kinase [Solirubrobacteraceae bacterium]
MISRTVLVAPEPFGGLSAARAAAAIGRGLTAGDPSLEVDLCPIEVPAIGSVELEAIGFDTRMRAARAVILGAGRLDERTLLGSATFELATRARQAGVPAYAVAGESALSLFDARILDLQVVLRGRDTRALRRAGERLAGLV